MKLLRCEASNFGSFKELELDFTKIGLALIYGKTGAGKSTILDVIVWILYGQTAKGGSVDDIRPWGSTEPTCGEVEIELTPGVTFIIGRIRGKANQNDLYYFDGEGSRQRGKDVNETQKLINEKLGMDCDTFISACYFHEYSPASSFFVAKAKDRRDLLEKLADLSFPQKLAELSSAAKKKTKQECEKIRLELTHEKGKYESYVRTLKDIVVQSENWIKNKSKLIIALEKLKDNFDTDLASKIQDMQSRLDAYEAQKKDAIEKTGALIGEITKEIIPDSYFEKQLQDMASSPCPTCGSDTTNQEAVDTIKSNWYKMREMRQKREQLFEKLETLQSSVNPYSLQIEQLKSSKNTYDTQITLKNQEVNPFDAQHEKLAVSLEKAERRIAELSLSLNAVECRLNDFNLLYDLTPVLRSELLKSTINSINSDTNEILEQFFNGEFRVDFTVEDDNLDIVIYKSGNECNFKQLSKGQRQMLKLSFAVAVMKAASNRSGTHFDVILLDEPTDGLDVELKMRSYDLFNSLHETHSSVLVIEHSQELSTLFQQKFHVKLVGDHSVIES